MIPAKTEWNKKSIATSLIIGHKKQAMVKTNNFVKG